MGVVKRHLYNVSLKFHQKWSGATITACYGSNDVVLAENCFTSKVGFNLLLFIRKYNLNRAMFVSYEVPPCFIPLLLNSLLCIWSLLSAIDFRTPQRSISHSIYIRRIAIFKTKLDFFVAESARSARTIRCVSQSVQHWIRFLIISN